MVDRDRLALSGDPVDFADIMAAVLAALVVRSGGRILLTTEEVNQVLGVTIGITRTGEHGLITVTIKPSGSERPVN